MLIQVKYNVVYIIVKHVPLELFVTLVQIKKFHLEWNIMEIQGNFIVYAKMGGLMIKPRINSVRNVIIPAKLA